MSVAKNTFFLTSALVGQKILSFVYFTLLARFFGPEDIGKYTFALAFTTIFSIITDLGLTPFLVRETAKTKERAGELLRAVLTLKIGLIVLAYGSVILASYLLGYPALIIKLIFIAGLIMAMDGIHLSFYGVLRGLGQLKYESLGMVIGQTITLALGGVFLLINPPLVVFLIALACGSVFNVIYSFFVIKKHGIKFLIAPGKEILKTIAKSAVPFALAGFFTKIYSYMDTVLLRHIKGDMEVGWYSVPYKITYAFQFLPLALSAAIFPAIANAWKNDRTKVQEIFEKALTYCLIISLPLAFGIASLAPQIILKIYGQPFANSILPLEISIFGLIFVFLYFPIGAALNATDRQNVNTFFMGLTMVANIFLNLILIPRFGAVGASLAAVCTNAFLFFSTFIWSLRVVRPSKNFLHVFIKTIFSVAIMSATVLVFKKTIAWPLTIPLGAFVYLGLLYLLKTFSLEEIAKIKSTLKSFSA
ncbi:MAG: flippase [bacterium]|nr:flippase [bacterium]